MSANKGVAILRFDSEESGQSRVGYLDLPFSPCSCVCVFVGGQIQINVCRWRAELNFRCHSVGTSHLVFLLEVGSLSLDWLLADNSLTRCLEIPRDLPVCITLSMPRTAGITGLHHHAPFFLSHWFWAANSVPRLARQASFSLTEPSR